MGNTITDCGMPTRAFTCREHNVNGCSTCINETGCCDWGGCHARAVSRVYCIRVATGVTVETRPLCVKHAKTWSQMTDGGRWSYDIGAAS